MRWHAWHAALFGLFGGLCALLPNLALKAHAWSALLLSATNDSTMRTFLVHALCALGSNMLAAAAPNAHAPPHLSTARSLLEGVGDPVARSLLEHVLTEQEVVRADLKRAEAEITDLRGQLDTRRADDASAAARRLAEQPRPEPSPEPDQGEAQMIYRRTLLTSGTKKKPGKESAQHRRTQQLCPTQMLPTRLGGVTDECCNEPEEDCSTGTFRAIHSSRPPATCSPNLIRTCSL